MRTAIFLAALAFTSPAVAAQCFDLGGCPGPGVQVEGGQTTGLTLNGSSAHVVLDSPIESCIFSRGAERDPEPQWQPCVKLPVRLHIETGVPGASISGHIP